MSVTDGAVSCPQGKDPGHVCVALGASFTLSVDAVGIPAGGYVLAQSWIDYGNDLVFKSSQTTWPDCNVNTDLGSQSSTKGSNHVAQGCLTGLGTFSSPLFASTHIGGLVDYNFTCSSDPSVNEVKLLAVGTNPAGTSGAMYTEEGTNTQFLPAVNNVTINCVAPVSGTMAMDAIGDSPSPSPVDAKRTVSVGVPFLVTAHVTNVPSAGAGGYPAYRAAVRWD